MVPNTRAFGSNYTVFEALGLTIYVTFKVQEGKTARVCPRRFTPDLSCTIKHTIRLTEQTKHIQNKTMKVKK